MRARATESLMAELESNHPFARTGENLPPERNLRDRRRLLAATGRAGKKGSLTRRDPFARRRNEVTFLLGGAAWTARVSLRVEPPPGRRMPPWRDLISFPIILSLSGGSERRDEILVWKRR